MNKVVMKTNIPGARLINRGKVRDIYDAGENLVIVTTDRISAFDVIMNDGIPYKGIVLNQISKYWFNKTKSIIKNHFISDNVDRFPEIFKKHWQILEGRSMLVRKANPFPVECVVRGYLAGSAWKDYQKSTDLYGYKLPSSLKNSSKLPFPIFTPSTKAEEGHDLNITYEEMQNVIDPDVSKKIKSYSLAVYKTGVWDAEEKGIIIADTKFEFGLYKGEIILIDEVMTPDSSRFWPSTDYETGKNQPSLDKQYLRDYLETLDWNKTPPPPKLPDEIIQNTSLKYVEILKILTGKTVQDLIS
jgi:phosphoribosylaminoimidazole-succinocarboxamide synthase